MASGTDSLENLKKMGSYRRECETMKKKNITQSHDNGTRFYIIGTDGNTHGEADTMTEAAAILEDVKTSLAKRYGESYVEDLELEIVEGR